MTGVMHASLKESLLVINARFLPGPVMCEDCFKVYASVKDLKLHLSQSGHMCKFECGDCGEPRPTLDLK